MRSVIAFDVGHRSSVMVAYDELGNLEFESRLFHSQKGFSYLKERIDFLSEKHGQVPEFVFEATGVYSGALERFLQENTFIYYRLNPLEAHFHTLSLRRNKTDKSDAHKLAKRHFKSEKQQAKWHDSYYDQMRVMSRRYDEIDKELIQYKNRLHATVQLTFPELEEVFKTKSNLFYNVLQVFPHPEVVLNYSKTIIKNKVKKCTLKNDSVTNLEDRTLKLIEAAQNSYPAVNEYDYNCRLVEEYARKVQEMEVEKKNIIKMMANLSKNRKEYQILHSFPGIQDTLACRLIGELGDLSRFENNKQLNAYAGIDIVRYQSGNMEYKDRINKRGNSRLRGIMYFMIVSMLSSKGKKINHIVDYYYKLKMQPYNKHHKVAVVACMNKFLKTAFHLIQHDLLYDYKIASDHS